MATEGSVFVPLPIAERGCVVCNQIDAKITLMTPESRDILTRQLQDLAEEIRRMEARLAEDKPLFIHQDCLKPSKFSLPPALQDLVSNRYNRNII